MSLLPGDDHHTHVKYSDAYGASAVQESLQALAERVDRLEEIIVTLADASHKNAVDIHKNALDIQTLINFAYPVQGDQ